MKKGRSYSCFTSAEKPNHPLVKAFKAKGLDNLEFIYASHWSSDAGWTVQSCSPGPKMLADTWWGFTIAEAVRNVEKAQFKKTFGDTEFLTFTDLR